MPNTVLVMDDTIEGDELLSPQQRTHNNRLSPHNDDSSSASELKELLPKPSKNSGPLSKNNQQPIIQVISSSPVMKPTTFVTTTNNNNNTIAAQVIVSPTTKSTPSVSSKTIPTPLTIPTLHRSASSSAVEHTTNNSPPLSPVHLTIPSKSNYTNTLTSIDTKFRKWINNKYGRYRKRVVFKNGDVNLSQTKVSKRKRRYLADLFTTLVDIQWRWTLLIFTLSFILSWLAFALIWWVISYSHGDLDPDNRSRMGSDYTGPDKFETCIGNFNGFTSAFLFSIETQHTIGYGFRYTTEECPMAIIVMCVQSILGVVIQALMVGIVFAKMSRPKKRTQTLMFSRNAVVCQRDGQLCLMLRVGDMRKSHIISANVRAQLIKSRVTQEGETLPYYQHELKVGVDSDQSQVFFIWPMMVVHKIDKDSPLYTLSAADLLNEKFEIVVILEGVIETTGATTQARSSFLPSEILWGHRFEPMVTFRKDGGVYTVDHRLFNTTYEVETPLCSAMDLEELNRIQEELRKQGTTGKLLAPFRIPSIAQHSIP